MEQAPKPKENKQSAIQLKEKTKKLHFLSINDSQISILKTILAIHLPHRKNYQCDLTAWKLGFYKDGVKPPTQCYDKYASMLNDDRIKDLSDFDRDWHDGTFENIVIDLPCSVEMPSTKSRFDVSSRFSSIEELMTEHEKMLRLAHRKMQTDGILVYKTMDFTFDNVPIWLSDEVLRMAKDLGFVLIDKYIYNDTDNCKRDRRRTRYASAIPAHAYFFVFKKIRQPISE